MKEADSPEKKALSKKKTPEKPEQSAGGRPGGARSRLSLALKKIQAEAARALQDEPAPRRLPGAAVACAPPNPELERGLSPEERRALAEVEDGRGRLLLCMDPRSALRQGLALRLLACAPRTDRGGRVLLRKRRGGNPEKIGLWDLYVTPVRPGEAGEEAARRLLEEEAGIGGPPLRLAAEVAGGEGLCGPLQLYTADLPAGILPDPALGEVLAVDADELAALAGRGPELLTPELLWAAFSGVLFRQE